MPRTGTGIGFFEPAKTTITVARNNPPPIVPNMVPFRTLGNYRGRRYSNGNSAELVHFLNALARYCGVSALTLAVSWFYPEKAFKYGRFYGFNDIHNPSGDNNVAGAVIAASTTGVNAALSFVALQTFLDILLNPKISKGKKALLLVLGATAASVNALIDWDDSEKWYEYAMSLAVGIGGIPLQAVGALTFTDKILPSVVEFFRRNFGKTDLPRQIATVGQQFQMRLAAGAARITSKNVRAIKGFIDNKDDEGLVQYIAQLAEINQPDIVDKVINVLSTLGGGAAAGLGVISMYSYFDAALQALIHIVGNSFVSDMLGGVLVTPLAQLGAVVGTMLLTILSLTWGYETGKELTAGLLNSIKWIAQNLRNCMKGDDRIPLRLPPGITVAAIPTVAALTVLVAASVFSHGTSMEIVNKQFSEKLSPFWLAVVGISTRVGVPMFNGWGSLPLAFLLAHGATWIVRAASQPFINAYYATQSLVEAYMSVPAEELGEALLQEPTLTEQQMSKLTDISVELLQAHQAALVAAGKIVLAPPVILVADANDEAAEKSTLPQAGVDEAGDTSLILEEGRESHYSSSSSSSDDNVNANKDSIAKNHDEEKDIVNIQVTSEASRRSSSCITRFFTRCFSCCGRKAQRFENEVVEMDPFIIKRQQL